MEFFEEAFVTTPTKESYDRLMAYFDDNGIEWNSGHRASELYGWHHNRTYHVFKKSTDYGYKMAITNYGNHVPGPYEDRFSGRRIHIISVDEYLGCAEEIDISGYEMLL